MAPIAVIIIIIILANEIILGGAKCNIDKVYLKSMGQAKESVFALKFL